jgi:hypothetical protein
LLQYIVLKLQNLDKHAAVNFISSTDNRKECSKGPSFHWESSDGLCSGRANLFFFLSPAVAEKISAVQYNGQDQGSKKQSHRKYLPELRINIYR